MSKRNPYVENPDHTFWGLAISDRAVGEIDPATGLDLFQISPNDAVMTMGSCFAQHVSKKLSNQGLNFLVTENHSEGIPYNHDFGYGVFTARYGNIYTIAQSIQLLKRCTGEYVERGDVWMYKNNWIDSFRPRAVPGGFDSEKALLADREIHLAATLKAFKTANVLVFTLGLTEGWKNIETGQVYSVAPGVAGGEYNPNIHKPFNMSVSECIDGLREMVDILRFINPTLKIILTVSPVPLAATHSNSHVLTATFSSKAKLRVAAEEISDAGVGINYFPSFEIIQGLAQSGRYFKHDLREVESRGVNHVMRIFLEHYFGNLKSFKPEANASISGQDKLNAGILCDDDLLIETQN